MRVLLIGPNFHYFNQSIERAFRVLGYEVRVEGYYNPVHPYTLWNKICYKFSRNKIGMKAQSKRTYQSTLIKVYNDFLPNYVFVMNGDMLDIETIRQWQRKDTKIAIWFFDSFMRIPLCEENISIVNDIYCYELSDIPLIKYRYGIDAHFFPQAVDTQIYHPLEGFEKKYDIVFAGDMVHSQKRRILINAIVEHYPHLRIKVWGEYKLWYKNPIQWLFREKRDVYMNRNASGEVLNKEYNQARIVLNIHHEQQKNGANPKLYEIAASGAYQICDANPYIEQLFPNGEIGIYHNQEELFTLIDFALSHDMRENARQAYETIVKNHTFVKRIKNILFSNIP